MKATILSILTSLLLISQTIEQIVNLAVIKNGDIDRFILKSRSLEIDSKVLSMLDNPTLSMGLNDISISKPIDRGLEPMQSEYIAISQSIPITDRLEIKRDIIKLNSKIEDLNRLEFERTLKFKIYELSYKYLILEAKESLLNELINNLKRQRKLKEYLYNSSKATMVDILGVDNSIESSKIDLETISYLKNELLIELERLSFSKIEAIEGDIWQEGLVDFNIDSAVENHPKLLILKERLEENIKERELIEKSKTPDLKFTLGYYHRQKYDDYISLNLSFPLKNTNREDLKLQSKSTLHQLIESQIDTLKFKMKRDIRVLIKASTRSQAVINSIQESLISLNRKIESLLEIYSSFSRASLLDIQKNIEKRIRLRLKVLDELNRYLFYISKLKYYVG